MQGHFCYLPSMKLRQKEQDDPTPWPLSSDLRMLVTAAPCSRGGALDGERGLTACAMSTLNINSPGVCNLPFSCTPFGQ